LGSLLSAPDIRSFDMLTELVVTNYIALVLEIFFYGAWSRGCSFGAPELILLAIAGIYLVVLVGTTWITVRRRRTWGAASLHPVFGVCSWILLVCLTSVSCRLILFTFLG
jgi:hypothetical protein